MPDGPSPSKAYITAGQDIPPSRAKISHAVVVDNTCYVGGQLSVDEAGTYQKGNARQEAERSFANFFAVLKGAGFAVEDIVYLDLAFKDLSDLPTVSELYNELFRQGTRPCRIVTEVSALPYDALFRVNGVAIKGADRVPVRGAVEW